MSDERLTFPLSLDPESVQYGLVIKNSIDTRKVIATEFGGLEWFLFVHNAGPDLMTAQQILKLSRRIDPVDQRYELGFGISIRSTFVSCDLNQYGLWTPLPSLLHIVPLGKVI